MMASVILTDLFALPSLFAAAQPTNWTPGIAVVAIAAVAAVALLLVSRHRAPEAAQVDPKLLDLERRAQQLVEQLRELTAEKHQLDAADYDAKRARLEADAAAALRARDAYLQKGSSTLTAPPAGAQPAQDASSSAAAPAGPGTAAAATAPARPAGFWARNPQLKGAVWGALIVGFFGAVGVFLKDAEKPRGENGTMTGRDPNEEVVDPRQAGGSPGADAQLSALKDRLAKNPKDVDATADLAHWYLLRQGFTEAQEYTKQGAALDPFHLETRIHSAVLKGTQGDVNTAFKELDHLARVYPDSYEAFFFLGAMAMELGDLPRALESLERFVAQAPPEDASPQLYAAIAQLRQQVRGNANAPAHP